MENFIINKIHNFVVDVVLCNLLCVCCRYTATIYIWTIEFIDSCINLNAHKFTDQSHTNTQTEMLLINKFSVFLLWVNFSANFWNHRNIYTGNSVCVLSFHLLTWIIKCTSLVKFDSYGIAMTSFGHLFYCFSIKHWTAK